MPLPPRLEERLAVLMDARSLDAETGEAIRSWLVELLGEETDEPVSGPTEGLFGIRSMMDPAGGGLDAPLPTRERYALLSRLGGGGMGEVWRVRDRDLGRTVAMKLLHPDHVGSASLQRRFIEEARVAAQLAHPGIVPVYDIGRLPDGRFYFTMPRIQGRTLRGYIKRHHRGEASLASVVSVFRAACRAVAYAHARGVIHRDLKPANIMISRQGQVLVLDWGLARVQGSMSDDEPVETGRSELHATRVGAVMGTPAYMSPEQAYGLSDRVDARSDVYALGAVLYEILTGSPPYTEGGGEPVLQQVLAGPPLPVRRGPAALQAICHRAMARERDERFTDAAALAAAVSAVLTPPAGPAALR